MSPSLPVEAHHLQPAGRVRIIAGFFAGVEGRLVRHLEHSRRVRVEVIHAGQRRQVELRAGQVKAATG